jgi:tripartite-type tricarboxylate transporter receptor subunit TctC
MKRLLAWVIYLVITTVWSPVCAQSAGYPTKPVRLVVPGAAGASADTAARLVAQKLGEIWKQQLVVDNRPGAGGILGAQSVATAIPDGYTLLATNPSATLQNVLLRKNPPYAVNDFAPIVYLGSTPLIVAASMKLPAANMNELVAYAKANPGKVRGASVGTGSNPHTVLEIFKYVNKVDILHVPYKGGVAPLAGMVSGEVDIYYTTVATAESLVAAGRLKVLGVGGPKRLPALPNVATLTEQGIDNTGANYWYGFVTTAKTPRPIIEKINRDVNAALQTADLRNRFSQIGIDVEGGTPEAFAAHIKTEAGKLAALVKSGALQYVD